MLVEKRSLTSYDQFFLFLSQNSYFQYINLACIKVTLRKISEFGDIDSSLNAKDESCYSFQYGFSQFLKYSL